MFEFIFKGFDALQYQVGFLQIAASASGVTAANSLS